ncbi:MAG: hypothetical protein BGO49_25785 [Planctomycetales bacterium 71-10]|nr:MAG: hypothetical protein BGO49_25785 [Planctomycetales bacterium 71-10]
MAAVDPYSPCPCGSGEKYKWCCQKAESYVERAMRLERNGQHEAALAALNEGLAKAPGSPWLLLRKAVLLSALGRIEETDPVVDELLAKHPTHPGARSLQLRLLLASARLREAVDLFQKLLEDAADRGGHAPVELAVAVGSGLFRAGFVASALAHLELAAPGPEAQAAPPADRVEMMRRELAAALCGAPNASPWLKNPYALAPRPAGLGDDAGRRFDEALGWADRGLWERASAAFELLSGEPAAARAAETNQGLCRLRLADHAGAVAGIRRGLAGASATTDAVDLEALCQLIDPSVGPDPVEEVELSWTLRDRAGLLQRLRADRSCVERVDPEAEEGDDLEFALLDRPRPEDGATVAPADLPLVVGSAIVEAEALKLEAFDDGRLEALTDRLTAIAGPTVPPAHPKTRELGPVSRQSLVLDVACQPPAGLSPQEQRRLVGELAAARLRSQWPETPMPFLGGKTPREAGRAGGSEVPLRAALLLLESQATWGGLVDWAAFREELGGVPAEPAIDPIDVELDRVHIGRLKFVDPHGLDDERLVDLRARASRWGLLDVIAASCREIANRRRLLEREGFPTLQVFADLAMDAVIAGDRDAALAWVARGRESEPAARRPATAPSWDMLAVRVRTMTDAPEDWVPEVADVLARYEGNAQAMQQVLSNLIDLGLVELAPSPDEPGRYVADPTTLYSLLARYGPRVQAVGGAPAGGGIWTPGSQQGGGGGGLWTPGSQPAAPAAEKPRIILPGR